MTDSAEASRRRRIRPGPAAVALGVLVAVLVSDVADDRVVEAVPHDSGSSNAVHLLGGCIAVFGVSLLLGA